MELLPLTAEDEALIAEARAAIERGYRYGWHHIGAAVRMGSGRVFTAVHLEANAGRVAVCAEAVAIGRAFRGKLFSLVTPTSRKSSALWVLVWARLGSGMTL